MQNVDLSIVFDGLNALGRVPWRINQRVLTVAQRCWDNNIPLGDIPSKDDNPLPEEPLHPKRQEQFWEPETPGYESYVEEYRLYRESWNKFRRVKQRNMVRDLGREYGDPVYITISCKLLTIVAHCFESRIYARCDARRC